jgi:hypothetical protein
MVEEYARNPRAGPIQWDAGDFEKTDLEAKLPSGAIEVRLMVPEEFEWIVWPEQLGILNPEEEEEEEEAEEEEELLEETEEGEEEEEEVVEADIRAENWEIITWEDLEGMEEEN